MQIEFGAKKLSVINDSIFANFIWFLLYVVCFEIAINQNMDIANDEPAPRSLF